MKVLILLFVFSFHTFASLEKPVLESTCEETDADTLTWDTLYSILFYKQIRSLYELYNWILFIINDLEFLYTIN